jgi:hypothetical protein
VLYYEYYNGFVLRLPEVHVFVGENRVTTSLLGELFSSLLSTGHPIVGAQGGDRQRRRVDHIPGDAPFIRFPARVPSSLPYTTTIRHIRISTRRMAHEPKEGIIGAQISDSFSSLYCVGEDGRGCFHLGIRGSCCGSQSRGCVQRHSFSSLSSFQAFAFGSLRLSPLNLGSLGLRLRLESFTWRWMWRMVDVMGGFWSRWATSGGAVSRKRSEIGREEVMTLGAEGQVSWRHLQMLLRIIAKYLS